MRRLRSGLRVLARTLAAAALCACTQPTLSSQDQADVYRQAFAQAEIAVFGQPPHPPLILDPRLLPEAVTMPEAPRTSTGLLDAPVLRQMRNLVCAPSARDDECLNGVRGLAVRLSPIHRESSRHVTFRLLVNPVQAAGDNTQLVHLNRLLRYEGFWRDGRWWVRPAPGGAST